MTQASVRNRNYHRYGHGIGKNHEFILVFLFVRLAFRFFETLSRTIPLEAEGIIPRPWRDCGIWVLGLPRGHTRDCLVAAIVFLVRDIEGIYYTTCQTWQKYSHP